MKNIKLKIEINFKYLKKIFIFKKIEKLINN